MITTLHKDAKPVTRVVFRRWKRSFGGGIIALFPDIDHNRTGLVSSYERIGQHGGASYPGVIRNSVPATPEEYDSLKRELESYPFDYVLRAVKRA